jgi:hypothetical protein
MTVGKYRRQIYLLFCSVPLHSYPLRRWSIERSSVAGGGSPPFKTHRRHRNLLLIVTDTGTLGNEIPVDFVGKTGATEEATAVRRERRRTWKRGERMQATTGMRCRMPRDVGDDSVVEIQGN